MGDFLAYRIPQKEVVRLNGNFRLLGKPYIAEGFIVSSFDKQDVYRFEEDKESTPELHFKSKKPYIVSRKEYLIGAETLLNAFPLFGLKKAVYSRVKSVHFDENKTEQLFESLVEKYPMAFVYLISSKMFGTWIGATPEVLLSMHGQQGYTMSLAGTKQTLQLADNWNEKEQVEQFLVSDYIHKKLELQELQEIEQHGPFEIEAGPVKHLRTDFSFFSPDKNALEIALELHPTPAVAGVPTKEAMDLISTVEHNNRLLYTGFLGEMSAEHNHLYVNLRCCQIQEKKAFLYVGGGFTSDSIPDDEWHETESKARTLQQVIEKVNK